MPSQSDAKPAAAPPLNLQQKEQVQQYMAKGQLDNSGRMKSAPCAATKTRATSSSGQHHAQQACLIYSKAAVLIRMVTYSKPIASLLDLRQDGQGYVLTVIQAYAELTLCMYSHLKL